MNNFAREFIVTPQDIASAMGSGDLDVLATPAVVAMAENIAKDYVMKYLTPTQTSVGTSVSLKHLKPSLLGATIIVRLTEIKMENNKFSFGFQVIDQNCLVAVGEHTRAIVEKNEFLNNNN